MSFSDLVQSSVAKRSQEVKVPLENGEMVFHANELSVTQRIKLAQVEKSGGDTYGQWIAFSITDQDGKRMSMDQVARLPEEVVVKFMKAVMDVNSSEDNKKKSQK